MINIIRANGKCATCQYLNSSCMVTNRSIRLFKEISLPTIFATFRVSVFDNPLARRVLSQVAFHLPHFIQTQFPAFNRSGDLYVNKPADDATDDHRNHAPKTDGHDPSELECSVEQDHDRPQAAQKNVELKPVFQPAKRGKYPESFLAW